MMYSDLPLRHALHIDGLSLDHELLSNTVGLERFVRNVAKRTGMTIFNLSSASIGMDGGQQDNPTANKEHGYSILALITTSHIALHVWPATNYLMFDLVSCKEFDIKKLYQYVCHELAIDKVLYDNSHS